MDVDKQTSFLIQQYLTTDFPNEGAKLIKNDNNLFDDNRMHRDKDYTELINIYTTHLKKTLSFKYITRIVSYIIFTFILLSITVFGICIIGVNATKNRMQISEIVAIVSATASMISTMIIIPQIIIEFIFNKEEDKYIVDMIKNTQQYDSQLYFHENSDKKDR
ncbi:hypothetical protein [Thomasclavelia sp.]|uniref:hypothetical protein n=1 Tax=Thomasclavelia sp. TaxID=3025757 RepID=UPI00260105D6|nr:hypothetical protein [Thomasclavelia sp.]